ncbi:uncharacterized protein LOC111873546 [Cryptotermes secundus]|uniref:uncharacterized protein LOC111873546 n=1 Tax=Cryptotermes secundus TaxID=105785 RepID=UPI000CD7C19F|nr:uncharacterized protein LOC111873546 [Cryptotermes secundus]
MGVQENVNSANRLIILHAGTSNDFIPEAKLVYKAGGATGDYHGQMNGHNFQKWLTEKLVPHVPPQSVMVLDSAPYHCVQIDKPPTPYSLKKDMISWLRHKGDESMWKNDLYNQILSLKPKEKAFKIDSILSGHGHSVIRLPPYMSDLNPIELAWAKIKLQNYWK